MLSEKGRTICSLTYDLTIYTDVHFPSCSDGVLNFYHTFMDHFASMVAWYTTETMANEKKLTPKVLTAVETWFDDKKSKFRRQYGMSMHSGNDADDYVPPAINIFSSAGKHTANYLRIILPIRSVDADSKLLLDITKNATKHLPFLSGHGGYALYYNTKSQNAKIKAGNLTGPLLLKHPGIDIGATMNTSLQTLKAIKGVNWLTLLNYDFCNKLGGLDNIRNKLSNGIVIHELENGIILQAGAKPEMGDINKGETLPLYREVSQLIRPIRLYKHRQIHGLNMEQTERWFERFDD